MITILYPFYVEDGAGNSDYFKTEKEAISYAINSIGTEAINQGAPQEFYIYEAIKFINIDEEVENIRIAERDRENEKLRTRVEELTRYVEISLDRGLDYLEKEQKRLLEKDWK